MTGDIRAGFAIAVPTVALLLLSCRRNGFGWRTEDRKAERLADSVPLVRATWLIQVLAWVMGIVAILAIAAVIAS